MLRQFNGLTILCWTFSSWVTTRSQQTFNAMLRFESSCLSSHDIESYFVLWLEVAGPRCACGWILEWMAVGKPASGQTDFWAKMRVLSLQPLPHLSSKYIVHDNMMYALSHQFWYWCFVWKLALGPTERGQPPVSLGVSRLQRSSFSSNPLLLPALLDHHFYVKNNEASTKCVQWCALNFISARMGRLSYTKQTCNRTDCAHILLSAVCR